jgi:hypothetical protein
MTALTPALTGLGATFGDDVAFLRRHTEVVVLSDASGSAQLAVAPAWQGRVMTSTAQGDGGRSFGWVNRDFIAKGEKVPHMNPYGGEDRIWLGPEGGQFSVYFQKGASFDYEHWFTPAAFDTDPFQLVSHSKEQAKFKADFPLTNYSGTQFQIGIEREIRLLSHHAEWKALGLSPAAHLAVVGYESDNTLINRGSQPWTRDTGLLSIWILGMFTPSPAATIAVPIKAGPESDLGIKVTSNYFGEVPADRLKVGDDVVFLRGDGKFRSKIGINPRRSRGVLGSYDAEPQVLTIVQFDQPEGVTDYVNSLWQIQAHPFAGDVANSYNDGPPTPGAKPMGPFIEMESSSPAAALAPGGRIEHVHRTFHLTGSEDELDQVSRAVLGIPLASIKAAFPAD